MASPMASVQVGTSSSTENPCTMMVTSASARDAASRTSIVIARIVRMSPELVYEITRAFAARFPRAVHAQRVAVSVFERLDRGGDLEHRVAHGCKSVVLVGFREQLGLDHSGPVGEREKFHRLAGD